MRIWLDSHQTGKQKTKLTWRWIQRQPSPLNELGKGLHHTPRLQRGNWDGLCSSLSSSASGGRAWMDTEQIRGKKRWRAWSHHAWATSSLSLFLLASFLWQSAENRPRWQSHWRASRLPVHRENWSLWAISLQFAASLRPHVIKLSLWERVRKEKTTCDLICWFPENTTLQGAEGKGTEAGGETEVCNKDPSFSFQEVFKPAGPWGHHWHPSVKKKKKVYWLNLRSGSRRQSHLQKEWILRET